MKTMQESLTDGDGNSKSIVIVCYVQLSWKEKLPKFWEGQSKLQEGKVGRICTVSRTCKQQGLEGKICAILWRNRLGCKEGQYAVIVQFLGGISQETSSQNYIIPRGNWQLAIGVTGRKKIHNSQRELATGFSVTSSKKCTIPGGNWKSAVRSYWQGKLHSGREASLLIISTQFLSQVVEGLLMKIVQFLR